MRSRRDDRHIAASAWERWNAQTSRTWSDVATVLKETGIEMIDQDHRRLTEFVLEANRYASTGTKGVDLEYIRGAGDFLDGLMEFTRAHFHREEELIRTLKVDGIEKQETQHERFLGELDAVRHEFRVGRVTISHGLKLRLLEWVLHHVNEIDLATFELGKLENHLMSARSWEDLAMILRTTGIQTVDDDHRVVTIAALEFLEALGTITGSGERWVVESGIARLFDVFRTESLRHFTSEESLVERLGLDPTYVQRTQHKRFIAMLDDFRVRLGELSPAERMNVRLEVVRWWTRHINFVDRRIMHLERWTPDYFDAAKNADEILWLLKPTGIAPVDAEHANVIRLVFDIAYASAADSDAGARVATEGVARIIKAASTHFAHEEAIMKSMNVPLLDDHAHDHRRIEVELRAMARDIETTRAFSANMRRRLLGWWLNHTNYVDVLSFRDRKGGAA